jgi:hypothetical protein
MNSERSDRWLPPLLGLVSSWPQPSVEPVSLGAWSFSPLARPSKAGGRGFFRHLQ